jgi:CBS domain-containing protein
MPQTVGALMTPDPILTEPGTAVSECAKLMERHAIGALGVVLDGRLVGVLTDRDIVLRVIALDRDPHSVTAAEIASPGAVTVAPEATLDEAERRMTDYAVRRLFVLGADERPVGILTADDIAAYRDPKSVPAHQIREWGLWHSDQGYAGDSD